MNSDVARDNAQSGEETLAERLQRKISTQRLRLLFEEKH